jgi:prolyl oligopeptidase
MLVKQNWALLAAAVLSAGLASAQSPQLSYPAARKAEVTEELFEVKVADPYRWMEDAGSSELAVWIGKQNELSAGYLRRLALRGHFEKRLTELWNYPRTGVPVVENGRLFYRRNNGLERQSSIYMRARFDAPPALLLDANALSPDGSLHLADFRPSPDARLLVYALAEGGADWRTLRVREVASGRDLADELKWVRFSWISWTRDSKGFFYSRYPEPPQGKALQAELTDHALYYHRLGTPQSEDVLVYARADLPRHFIGGFVTEDGRYLLVRIAPAAGPLNRLYFADLGDPLLPDVRAAVKPLVDEESAEYSPIGNAGPVVFVRTDENASNRRIISIDVRDPRRAAWKTVVAEGKDAMRFSDLIADRIVIEYLSDAQTRLALFDRAGKPQGEIALPEPGAITGLYGRERAGPIYYEFTSPLYPSAVFAYDVRSGKSTPFEAPRALPDAGRYETRRFFAASKDGTRIPFFLTARKDLKQDGTNPTILFGYGGFAISTRPVYSPPVISWIELGGIWVSSNIRGGGEYGKAWHEAARGEKRQNAFDDFIAVAEHLVREKYSSPAALGILGGSNGGLLVSVVAQQRPDLFAVVLPAVGVFDMLRFDRFTGGRAWTREYGSPRDAEHFKHLLRYSPLHNVKPAACYPATLLTTADHDDRVVPSHSYKFAAALQAAQDCQRPILLRVEAKASHGYRTTEQAIAEVADRWAFTAEHTGLRPARH